MREGKIWGDSVEVVTTPFFSVHYIRIKKGGFCSEHKHEKKENIFLVADGRLLIRIWRPEGPVDEIVLGPGETAEIPAGVFHQFEALEETLAVEIYEVELSAYDIERRSVGGVK